MIPVILVSQSRKQTDEFVLSMAAQNEIPSFHIFTYEPEANSITIDQVREAKVLIIRSSFKKIVVMIRFDTAKSEAQNALLKTLEEHGDNSIFILVVNSYDALLPTIQSRCQLIRLLPRKTSLSKHFDIFGIQSIEEALSRSALIKKESYGEILDDIINTLYQDLINNISQSKTDNKKYLSIFNTALDIKKAMVDSNVNPEYAFDQLLIELHKHNIYLG